MQDLYKKKAIYGLPRFNILAFMAENQSFTWQIPICINIPCGLLI